MKNRKVIQEMPIYNCHIHTFTFENTPPRLFLLQLTNPRTGKISLTMLLYAVLKLLILIYLALFLLPTLLQLEAQSLLPFAPVSSFTIYLPAHSYPLLSIQIATPSWSHFTFYVPMGSQSTFEYNGFGPIRSAFLFLLPILLFLQFLLLIILIFLTVTFLRLVVPLIYLLLITGIANVVIKLTNLIKRLFASAPLKRSWQRSISTTLNDIQENQEDQLAVQRKNSIYNFTSNLTKTTDTITTFARFIAILSRGLSRTFPGSNDVLDRYAQFFRTSALGTQLKVFDEIRKQYPKGTKFVILPMNMDHMGECLGKVQSGIHSQHDELLELARKVNTESGNEIIYPFYTIHPVQSDLEDVIRKMKKGEIFGEDKFRGLKIYPNLGYKPNDLRLMDQYKVYEICEDYDVPVISHCTPKGIWKLGMSARQRRRYGHPYNYKKILEKYRQLRLCLAHFGGAEEWIRRLQQPNKGGTWGHIIYEMIGSGEYPNLFTDISYTIFQPKVKGWTIDLMDNLKVMLQSNKSVRERVLFGSDYYMIEQEKISEKEISILLRSRLGEDLYKQIAYTNPREFLGIESPRETITAKKKKSTRR